MMQAMTLAAENPETTQKVAQYGVAGVEAVKRGDTSGSGSVAGGAKVMAGAAVVGGVAVGAAAGSVALGVVGAGAAAYAATRNDQIGDAARATGQAAVAAGKKADEINKEHKITDKIGAAAKTTYSKAKELDEKHGITTKAAAGVTAAMNGITRKLSQSGSGQSGAAPTTALPPPPPPPPEGHVGVYAGPDAGR